MNFASLCTGAGGADLGLEQAGLDCIFQCEINRKCWPTLEKHWPNVRRTQDVNSEDTILYLKDTSPELIAFGFPCQDLSVAGKRKGLGGERSGLFFRCVEILDAVKPRWIIVENVAGLLSSNKGRDMSTVVDSLAEIGYRWAYRVLDSQYFGVPQKRRRVFIVGYLGEGRDPAKVLFESEGCTRDTKKDGEEKKEIARCLMASPSGYRLDLDTENFVVMDGDTERLAHSINDVKCYRTTGNCGVFDQGDKAGTLTCSTDPNTHILLQDATIRRLTPIEQERLMGWPDNHTIGSDSARYQMCGNGIVAPVAKWVGERLLKEEYGSS